MSVDNAHAGCPTFFIVVDQRVYDAIRLQREITRFLCPGDRSAVAAEITAEGATPGAEVTSLALAPTLLEMDRLRLSKVRATTDYDRAVGIAWEEAIADLFFHAIHFPRR